MRTLIAAGLMAAVAVVAAPAGADTPQASPSPKPKPQTMGEAAAATQKKKPAKVYTEDDLRNHGRKGSYSEPGAEGGTTAGANPSASPSPGAGEKKAGTPAEKPKTEDEIRADQ